MKYVYRDEKGRKRSVEIPKETIDRHMKDLGISAMEAIDLALFDLGIKTSPEADALTEKAQESGMSSAGNVSSGERVSSKRSDPVKEHLLWALAAVLVQDQSFDTDLDGKVVYVDEAHVAEDGKSVVFGYGDDTFEFKLTRKRTSKR